MSRCYRKRTGDVKTKEQRTIYKVESPELVRVTNVHARLRDAWTHCHGHLRYVDVSVLETG